MLQTRPCGVPRSIGSSVAKWLIERHLRRLSPGLEQLWRERAVSYERLVAELAARLASAAAETQHVLGLRPPARTPVVEQLERRGPVLARAAAAGEQLAEQALGDGRSAQRPIAATG